MTTSLEIAQAAELEPIEAIAQRAGLLPDEFEPYGRDKGKVSRSALDRLADVPDGGGGRTNGYPRESGFDITAASEVMAILAVARDLRDLRRRLGLYPEAERKLARFEADGLGRLPICMAKTHLSPTADPLALGAPRGFRLPVRDIRAYTGAEWLVPLCGDISQMPGLGAAPAATNVNIDPAGRTVGLF